MGIDPQLEVTTFVAYLRWFFGKGLVWQFWGRTISKKKLWTSWAIGQRIWKHGLSQIKYAVRDSKGNLFHTMGTLVWTVDSSFSISKWIWTAAITRLPFSWVVPNVRNLIRAKLWYETVGILFPLGCRKELGRNKKKFPIGWTVILLIHIH